MSTKYIINNASGQTINGGLTILGNTSIVSNPPINLSGSTGDKIGQIAFDDEYFYYCVADYNQGSLTVTDGGQTHVLDKLNGTDWNNYGGNYLQGGLTQDSSTPQAGWYIVDDNGTIRQILGDAVWFSDGNPTPIQNGGNWFMVLDGPWSISNTKTSIILYETLPTVSTSASSGQIWKSIKLNTEQNTTGVYRANLTQTGQILGYSLQDFKLGLIIGETYTITNYVDGDDFSNIANIQSGNINQTGCQFIATGEIPTNYTYGSELTSSGNFVVDVLENTLGFDIIWLLAPFGGYGYYIGFRDDFGPSYNSFPRNSVSIFSNVTRPFDWAEPFLSIISSVIGGFEKDDMINISVFDWNQTDLTNDALYYTPIEIRIKNNITPIQINGTLDFTFPYSYARYNLFCNEIETQFNFNTDDPTEINNITELINILNNNSNTNVLGTFSEDGSGGIILTMTTTTKQMFCQDGVLSFNIY